MDTSTPSPSHTHTSSHTHSRRPVARTSSYTTLCVCVCMCVMMAGQQMQVASAFLFPSPSPSPAHVPTHTSVSVSVPVTLMSATAKPTTPSTSFSSSAKGTVTLGPYKNGVLSLSLPTPQVDESQVTSTVAAAEKKRYKLTPVRFVEEGGTRMGHTIMCDWKASYVKGGDPKHNLRPGALLPKADIKNFMLELKEEQNEPLASFARAIATGMGQMETKVFECDFPQTANVEAWRGVTAKVQLLVKSINVKEDLPVDTRSAEEKSEAVRTDLKAKADAAARAEALAHYRTCLLDSTETETEKMESSVSWAKFGENSLKDYKWNLIQEAIATAENIDFSEVGPFLLRENPVTWT